MELKLKEGRGRSPVPLSPDRSGLCQMSYLKTIELEAGSKEALVITIVRVRIQDLDVMSFVKLPVVSVPVSRVRQAVIVVALPFCEAGAVRVPVSLKPTSVLGHVVAWADLVLASCTS